MEDREKIIRGLEKAYEKLIVFKREKNSPLIITKDNKIVEIDPSTINIHNINDCCPN